MMCMPEPHHLSASQAVKDFVADLYHCCLRLGSEAVPVRDPIPAPKPSIGFWILFTCPDQPSRSGHDHMG